MENPVSRGIQRRSDFGSLSRSASALKAPPCLENRREERSDKPPHSCTARFGKSADRLIHPRELCQPQNQHHLVLRRTAPRIVVLSQPQEQKPWRIVLFGHCPRQACRRVQQSASSGPAKTIQPHELRSSSATCRARGWQGPSWENTSFFSFALQERTPCVVSRMFLIVTQERPSCRFFQIHSFTASMSMCSTGMSFQSDSRWHFKCWKSTGFAASGCSIRLNSRARCRLASSASNARDQLFGCSAS